MQEFCRTLLGILEEHGAKIGAWCVLPNHYHAVIETPNVVRVIQSLGRMHGRLSFAWNGEENQRGRQVWCGAADRYMRSEAHFWATLNYVHYNPVRHGYVESLADWPFSSAADYMRQIGPAEAHRLWLRYPVHDYGQGWDDPAF